MVDSNNDGVFDDAGKALKNINKGEDSIKKTGHYIPVNTFDYDIDQTTGGCPSYIGLTMKSAKMTAQSEWEVSTFLGGLNKFPVVEIPEAKWATIDASDITAIANLARDNFNATPGTDVWGGPPKLGS